MDKELEHEIISKIEGCIPDLLGSEFFDAPAFEADLVSARAAVYDFSADYMHDHYHQVPREERLELAKKLSTRWV